MKKIITLIIIALVSTQALFAQIDANAFAQKVAATYGLENFKKAKVMNYTFNIKRDTFPASYRSWNWDMENNIVTMTTPKQTVTYRRDTIQSKEMKSVDGRFINDQYWFIFPYHVALDKGTMLTAKENELAPISKLPTTKLTIQYNKVDGYTPGDAYDLYINKDNVVTEWVYRNGGQEKPSLATKWEDNVTNAGVKTATNYTSEDGKFRIYFTGISVK